MQPGVVQFSDVLALIIACALDDGVDVAAGGEPGIDDIMQKVPL